MMFKKGKDDTCSDPTAWNFTADTTNGDKPLDAELNFDVYHVSKPAKLFLKTYYIAHTNLKIVGCKARDERGHTFHWQLVNSL